MTDPDPTNQPLRAQSSVSFHQDQILGGRYRVVSLLGQGGMGVVYKVEQIFLGKELALKTIQKSEQTDIALRRFEAEARAVFSVNHPNIIAVHDFGLLDDQTPFMAMEFVDGKTLGQILKTRQLSVDEAVPLFIQVCFGLAHAHENGVVHRDIKPNNIMLLNNTDWGTEGSVKILDFGIAKLAQHEGGEIQALTRTGEIFGSPLYMSPEQCLGGKLDHRSDIYSLGCVIFEALTGTPPFVGENAMTTMMMHQRETTPTLKEASLGQEFPPALEQIVRGMLAKNPDERYQNLGYAAHDLADMKRGVKVERNLAVTVPRPVKPDITPPDMVKIQKSSFYLILLSTAAFCAILTASAMLVLRPTKSAPIPSPPQTAEQIDKEKVEGTAPLMDIDGGIASQDLTLDQMQKKIERHEGEFFTSKFPTDKTLELFKDYEDLQHLELTNCGVSDAGFKNLNKSKVLNLVLAGDKNIRAAGEISKLMYLQRLNLKDSNITDEALTNLAKLPMLEQLDISGNNNLTEKGLMALTSSNSLHAVTLPTEKFSRKTLSALRERLPQCVFAPYFDKSKVQELELNLNGKNDPSKTYEYLYDLVTKENPLCRDAARYSIGLANQGTQSMQRREEYVKRAETISEKSNDLKQLADIFSYKAQRDQFLNRAQESLDDFERGLNLAIDTQMHNEPELMQRLFSATNYFSDHGDLAKAIMYSKLGERFLEQYPERNQNYLPKFDEKIGWSYYQLGQAPKGASYLERQLEYWRAHQNDPIKNDPDIKGLVNNPKNLYARALIERGHSELDTKKSKALYDEALQLLESLHMPEDINLNEHYCDACNHMADIYWAESNRAESLTYLRRGLAAVKQMKHSDANNRIKFFTDKINAQENSPK
ncbi:MAG: protein kinase [Cyanobacteria bacterium SZAS-4]|nr:protein kinase [Cyanobacteria bacterium SZAS-4]